MSYIYNVLHIFSQKSPMFVPLVLFKKRKR